MRVFSLCAALFLTLSIAPAFAQQASLQDRTRMAVSIADYIHDGDYDRSQGRPNPFKSDAVELGAVAIQGHWALGNWRLADESIHGQVFFFYECDHWNVGNVATGSSLKVQDLVARQGVGRIPSPSAARLVADLVQLESQHVAYLKPAKPEMTC
jgi:hypothetical protein